MSEREYEAVFWDIGGVILTMDSIRQGHRAFVTELVETVDTQRSTREALETWRDTLGEYFRGAEGTTYRPARQGYELAVEAVLDAEAASVEWEPLFQRIHTEHATASPGAVETIERLAAEPVHLGVISDVDTDEGKRILQHLGVFDSVDAFTSSEAVGRKKPDQAMFQTALEKAGVDPADGLMIGDRYENDMEGGRRAGLTTVAYGAEDGPAVDHHIEDLRAVLEIVGVGD